MADVNRFLGNNIISALSNIAKIKSKEVFLPISKRSVIIHPLTIGDDLSLKTAITSPANTDASIMELLWKHTDFIVKEPEQPVAQVPQQVVNESQNSIIENAPETTLPDIEKVGTMEGFQSPLMQQNVAQPQSVIPNHLRMQSNNVVNTDKVPNTTYHPSKKEFFETISYFDRNVLLWAMYVITYEDFAEQEIKCPHCEEKISIKIHADDLLHDDSMTIFDEALDFRTYTTTAKAELSGGWVLEFDMYIPTIQDYLSLLKLIPSSVIQKNIEKLNVALDLPQQMTLFTKRISLYQISAPEKRMDSFNKQEILAALSSNVEASAGEKFISEFTEKFNKYAIKLYYTLPCLNRDCNEEIKIPVDIEYEFFRRVFAR